MSNNTICTALMLSTIDKGELVRFLSKAVEPEFPRYTLADVTGGVVLTLTHSGTTDDVRKWRRIALAYQSAYGVSVMSASKEVATC